MPSSAGVCTPAAHLEKLVNHVGEDGHKLAALEDGQTLVSPQVQQSGAKFEA
jgi:hypothetical protein